MRIDALGMDFRALNERVRESPDTEVEIVRCLGQRYIAAGSSGRRFLIEGTPGNALGAYLDGSEILVKGNAQDALGDTMNGGSIRVWGFAGDAAGYAMRGGRIYIRGNVGYRAGIHMKAYEEKSPVLIAGGRAGSFLGEYQAGGTIIVLGLPSAPAAGTPAVGIPAVGIPAPSAPEAPIAGCFCGVGMHGGRIFLRTRTPPQNLPEQVLCREASKEDLASIEGELADFCRSFGIPERELDGAPFYLLTPDTANPYRQHYVTN